MIRTRKIILALGGQKSSHPNKTFSTPSDETVSLALQVTPLVCQLPFGKLIGSNTGTSTLTAWRSVTPAGCPDSSAPIFALPVLLGCEEFKARATTAQESRPRGGAALREHRARAYSALKSCRRVVREKESWPVSRNTRSFQKPLIREEPLNYMEVLIVI